MYDLIGDIHGHADELTALLLKLGYRKKGGTFVHPERRMIFAGDFIDRGPKIREVLQIVRPMIESGSALAVMGNHEFNAIAFHTESPGAPGRFLREHSEKNVKQHYRTIEQVGSELLGYIEWFKSLPLWLDLPELRVVHACWDQALINSLSNAISSELELEFLQRATNGVCPEYAAIETILKGKEIPLPPGHGFADKDGHTRKEVRIRWFEDLKGKSYAEAALPVTEEIPEVLIPEQLTANVIPYPAEEKPVFFGHYWLRAAEPALQASNVCCLDYSVAKGGFLTAYRWDGEQKLSEKNFVTV